MEGYIRFAYTEIKVFKIFVKNCILDIFIKSRFQKAFIEDMIGNIQDFQKKDSDFHRILHEITEETPETKNTNKFL